MYLFLITFLSLYGSMHLYVFFRMRDAFSPRPQLRWLLIIWMFFMTITPLLVRVAEQSGAKQTALFIAWPGYIWMGFLFIFTTILLFIDAIRQAYRVVVFMFTRQPPIGFSTYYSCRIALLLALVAAVYACIEAGQIRSEHVIITSPKLPTSISGIRIVQISDVHIGLLLQKYRLQHILEKVREAKPDILISTGDLVDGKLNRDDAISELNPLASLLASIPTPSGKYAVIGNHEVYAGLPQAVAFSRAAGFTIVRNRSLRLSNGITITGVDDQAVIAQPHADPAVENALLNAVVPDSFHILLKHRPDIQPDSDGRFDLQLSGHVHGGQIFPFNFLVTLKHPIPCGTTTTAKGSRIHVSRGTGTWGPPMRLFVPPEITIIDIIPSSRHSPDKINTH